MRFTLVCVVCSLLVLTPTFFVHGQVNQNIMGSAVNITLDSEFPNPGDIVTATLDDYSTNSSGATITWYFEGHELPAMKNKRSITIPTDTKGTDEKVSVELSFPSRPSLTAETTIHPIYLDVIVEPQTYTPIFYAGRALPVFGSVVNLTALVQLQTGMIDPTQYSYTWEVNDKVLYGGPQRGNNHAQVTMSYGLTSTLLVSVQNSSGVTIGSRLITIPSVPVDLQFYEESALYGLGQRAVGDTLHVIGNSTSLRAVPYYVSNDLFTTEKLQSEWDINGVPNTTDVTDPFSLNLHFEQSGQAQVGFTFHNLDALIQSASKSLTVTF